MSSAPRLRLLDRCTASASVHTVVTCTSSRAAVHVAGSEWGWGTTDGDCVLFSSRSTRDAEQGGVCASRGSTAAAQRASAARRAGKLHVITLRHLQVLQEVAPEPKSPGSREPERRSHMRSLFQEPGEAQEERRRHPLRLDTPERCR